MKTIVLTGATSGIGREIALGLLQLGHRVISNCSGLGKSEVVSAELKRITGKYIFHESEDSNISDVAKDEKLAERLWKISMNYISGYLV